jgi:hypothetical protein
VCYSNAPAAVESGVFPEDEAVLVALAVRQQDVGQIGHHLLCAGCHLNRNSNKVENGVFASPKQSLKNIS